MEVRADSCELSIAAEDAWTWKALYCAQRIRILGLSAKVKVSLIRMDGML